LILYTESVREVIIVANVVPHLVTLLGYNAPELQIPIGQMLSVIASDGKQTYFVPPSTFLTFPQERGLKKIMEYGGLLPLVSILSSKNPEVQQCSLRAIATLIVDGNNKHHHLVLICIFLIFLILRNSEIRT